jgi:hypothetical protein
LVSTRRWLAFRYISHLIRPMNEKEKNQFNSKLLIIAFFLSNLMFVTGASLFTVQTPISSTVSDIGKYCFIGTIPAYSATIILGFMIKGLKFVQFAPVVIFLTFVLAALVALPILWLIV